MSQPTKTAIKWLVGTALGLFFIWLGSQDWPIDLLFSQEITMNGTVLDAGTWRMDLLYLLPYFGALTLIHFLRVIRWQPLLAPIADIGFWRLNQVSAEGFMWLFLLPFRLGELARPYLISDRGDVGMAEALATVVVERIVDGLIVSALLFVVLFFLPEQGSASYVQIRGGAYLAIGIFSTALGVLIAAWFWRDWTMNLLDRIFGLLSAPIAAKVRTLIEDFYDGLSVLPSWRHLATFVSYSLVYWLLNGYAYYILALGFENLEIPLLAGYAMMCCVVVGMMLSNPPANVGVFWYFLLKPMALYGIATGNPSATAFALVAWLGQLIQQSAFGLYYVAKPSSEYDVQKSPETEIPPSQPA
ncbi:MAG TPA: flippase-like domain-containing protein [Myxococcales bacterium]|nr:flippase-like domain-containing protein [Myxococcales bacterium]